MRLPCPSTRMTSASLAASSTSHSDAPAMKSSTTASTASPSLDERVPQLHLGRHLAHVAVGSHGMHDVRVHLGREPVGHGEIGRRLAGVEDADAALPCERAQLGVVADERVQTAPDLEPMLEAAPQPAAPFGRQAASHRRDADEHGGGAQAQAGFEVAHHRNRAAEAQHVLHCFPGVAAVEYAHHPLRYVADAAVGGLRGHGLELAVGDDEKALRIRRRHQAGTFDRGATNSPVARSTAGSARPASPYTSPCNTCRSTTIVTASTGTATTRPTTPIRVPMVSTLAIVRTGGRARRRSMIRGTTTFASITCTATPSRITASTLTQFPVLTTNNAGNSVETSVPKNGTTATSPVKIPNASQYGTPSTHSPMAVKSASTSMASSWPTTQARSVAPASSRTRAPTGRCRGGSSDRMPSPYSRGCTAR